MGRKAKGLLLVGALAGLWMLLPWGAQDARGNHYSYLAVEDCYACHGLSGDNTAVEPNTSHIWSSLLYDMKRSTGGATPGIFGCTFCHQRVGNTVMRDAFEG